MNNYFLSIICSRIIIYVNCILINTFMYQIFNYIKGYFINAVLYLLKCTEIIYLNSSHYNNHN